MFAILLYAKKLQFFYVSISYCSYNEYSGAFSITSPALGVLPQLSVLLLPHIPQFCFQ